MVTLPAALRDGALLAEERLAWHLRRYVSFLAVAAKGQRSPMPTCRMIPAPAKLSDALVIQSSGVALIQCTPSA